MGEYTNRDIIVLGIIVAITFMAIVGFGACIVAWLAEYLHHLDSASLPHQEPPMVANVPEDPEPRPPLKPVSCGNCHFYDDDGDGSGEGVCMRYPPVVVHDAETMAETWWPDVDDTDWCGEFKPKELPPTDC